MVAEIPQRTKHEYMSSIKTTQIDGDVSVGRNVSLGGKAEVAGSAHIGHNLKVDGWLEAPNIKGANKGVFLTVQALREAYPNPHDGWMAGVGASTPFTAYIGNGGDWVEAVIGNVNLRYMSNPLAFGKANYVNPGWAIYDGGKLVESGEIKREKCWRGIKTTIINFEKYQNKSVLESETLSETLSETEGETESETFSETLSDTEQEYNKNNKKHKNKEELDTNVSSSVEVSPDQKPTKEEKIDFSGLLEFFNKTMESSNAVVPKIKSMSERRKKNIRARVREHGKRAVFEVITKAGTSDFLNGRNKNGWVADFDWIFRPNNFPKVLEGNYDNRPNTQINGNNRTSTYQEQRAAELTKLAGDYSAIIARRLAEDDARH